MNSWKSRAFAACAPPLSTFRCGTGRRIATPAGFSESYSSPVPAIARATAIDTPTIALAPRRALFGVPSAAIIAWSTASRESQSLPVSRSAISPLTFATACSTPLPA